MAREGSLPGGPPVHPFWCPRLASDQNQSGDLLSVSKLRDSELRYRRVFEAAQNGILILDAKTGSITDVIPFLIKMLGYSRKEFIERKLWEVGAFENIT
jgi:PAS domain-containing protein